MTFFRFTPALGLLFLLGCAGATSSSSVSSESASAPSPDPRVGLRAGLEDAGEAVWNLHVVSETPPPKEFAGVTNSDLAFTGKYAI